MYLEEYKNVDFLKEGEQVDEYYSPNDWFLQSNRCKSISDKKYFNAQIYFQYIDFKVWKDISELDVDDVIINGKDIDDFNDKDLHNYFNKWALVKGYSKNNLVKEAVDDVCFESLSGEDLKGIYYSKAGDSTWTLIETTKDENRINEIIAEETEKIETYLKDKKEKELEQFISLRDSILEYPKVISKKWYNEYHYNIGENAEVSGTSLASYHKFKVYKDSVIYRAEGHLTDRHDSYLAYEKGDTLHLLNYKMLNYDKKIYDYKSDKKIYIKNNKHYIIAYGKEYKVELVEDKNSKR